MRGDAVDQAPKSSPENQKDLTATIHLSSLRSVSDPVLSLLEKASPEEREVLSSLQIGSGMLIALSGPSRGARFLIDRDSFSIGRAQENDIFLDDVTVSRKHATITRNEGKFFCEDLGSLNGTYLNGSVVDRGELVDGSELQIGKFRLHFFVGGKGKR